MTFKGADNISSFFVLLLKISVLQPGLKSNFVRNRHFV